MKNFSWDDLHIFVAVARGGGLSAAAAETGLSPATVGRRMLALEEALGRRLFLRRQSGYALTADGRALYERARGMEAAELPIVEWLKAEGGRPVVRISAGTWTANFFAANFQRLWTANDNFRIAFKTTEARLDIAHRAVEIGIRNQAPTGAGLAGRKTGEVAFAPFCARGLQAARRDEWVAIAPEDASTRSAHWLNAQEHIAIAAWANSPHTLYDLIRAGVGKGVLPCFAGDRDATLERAGEEITELRNDQWLVMHNDDRHRPEVRTVIDRIVALVQAHAALFAGERPLGN